MNWKKFFKWEVNKLILPIFVMVILGVALYAFGTAPNTCFSNYDYLPNECELGAGGAMLIFLFLGIPVLISAPIQFIAQMIHRGLGGYGSVTMSYIILTIIIVSIITFLFYYTISCIILHFLRKKK